MGFICKHFIRRSPVFPNYGLIVVASKRSDDTTVEFISDSELTESKPQQADTPRIIHVQNSDKPSQLQNAEINATEELPEATSVNITARDGRPTHPADQSTENLLTCSKPMDSRCEEDLEPPPCNCPGIYIFRSSCILIQMKGYFISSRSEYSNFNDQSRTCVNFLDPFFTPRYFIFVRLLWIA